MPEEDLEDIAAQNDQHCNVGHRGKAGAKRKRVATTLGKPPPKWKKQLGQYHGRQKQKK